MVTKVDTIRVRPSQAMEDAKWAASRARKAAMLKSSDWTQLEDVSSGLAPSVKAAWKLWRGAVRSLSAKNFSTAEDFDEALSKLVAHTPTDVIRGEYSIPGYNPPPTPVVEDPDAIPNDLEQAKIWATRKIMAVAGQITKTWMADNGINPATFPEKLSQAMDALVAEHDEDGTIDGTAFPMINLEASITNKSIRKVATNVINLNVRASAFLATLESITQNCLENIRNTTSVDSMAITFDSCARTMADAESALSATITNPTTSNDSSSQPE